MDQLQSFRQDHKNFQRFSWIITGCALGLAAFIYWDSQNKVEKARSTSYVSVQGFAYPMEARVGLNYPERIHEYETMAELYYTLRYSADEATLKTVPNNFEKALQYLEPGETAENETMAFERDQITKNVLESGWSYTVRKDSILWDIWDEQGRVMSKPWKGYIFGRQIIQMGRRKIERKMNISFMVNDFPSGKRTHLNSFAATLSKTDVFNNEVISNN